MNSMEEIMKSQMETQRAFEEKGAVEAEAVASAVTEAHRATANGVVGVYKAIESSVVGVYKAIEKGVVDGYKKVEDAFVGQFLVHDGETVEEAKARLKNEPSCKSQQLGSEEVNPP